MWFRLVTKKDRYVDIGKLGVYYTANSQNYMFLDVIPWRESGISLYNFVPL